VTSVIVRTVSRLLAPFALLFGIYLIVFGHLAPGGGFQGGLAMATAIILIFTTFNTKTMKNLVEYVTFLEVLAVSLFLIIGLLGIVFGGNFLSNFLPVSRTYSLEAGTLPWLSLIIGIKVFAGLGVMYLYLFEMEGVE